MNASGTERKASAKTQQASLVGNHIALVHEHVHMSLQAALPELSDAPACKAHTRHVQASSAVHVTLPKRR